MIVVIKDKARNTHPHTLSNQQTCDDDIKVVPNKGL